MSKAAMLSFIKLLSTLSLVMAVPSVVPGSGEKNGYLNMAGNGVRLSAGSNDSSAATAELETRPQLEVIKFTGPQVLRRIPDTSLYFAAGENSDLVIVDATDQTLPVHEFHPVSFYRFASNNIIYTINRFGARQLRVSGNGILETQWEFPASPDLVNLTVLPDLGCILILEDGKMIQLDVDGSVKRETQTQSDFPIHVLPDGKIFRGTRIVELWDEEFKLLWRKLLTGPPLSLSIDAPPLLTSAGSLLYPVKEGIRLLNQDSSLQLVRRFSHPNNWYLANRFRTLGPNDELVAFDNNELLFINWKNEPFPEIFNIEAPSNGMPLVFTAESELIFWDYNKTITKKNLLGQDVWTYERDTELTKPPYLDENGNIYLYGWGETTILENAFIPITRDASPERPPIVPPVFAGSTDKPLVIDLMWEGQPGASHYKILRSMTQDMDQAIVLIDNLRATEYLDTSVILGNQYFYWLEVTGIEGEKRLSSLPEALSPAPLKNGDIAIQKRTDDPDFQIRGSELYPLKNNRLAYTGDEFVYILDEDLNIIGESAPYPVQLRDIDFLAHREFNLITAENETDHARIFRLADDASWELLYTAEQNSNLAGMAPLANNSHLIIEYLEVLPGQGINFSISIFNSNWEKIRKFTDTSSTLIKIIYSDPLGITYESDRLVKRYNFDGSQARIHPEILSRDYHITPDLRGGFWHRNSASHHSDVNYVDAYTLKPLTTVNLFQVPSVFESVLLGTDESGNCRVRETGNAGVRYHRVISPTGSILEEKSISADISDSRANSVTRDGYTLMFNQIDLNKPLVCLDEKGNLIFSRILDTPLIRSPFKSYHQHPNGYLYLTNNRDFLKVVMPGSPGILAHWDRGFARTGNLNHRMLPEIITPGLTMTPARDGTWAISLKAMAYSHEADVESIHVTLDGNPLVSSSDWQTERMEWNEPAGTTIDILVQVRFSNRPDAVEVRRHIFIPMLEFHISRDGETGARIDGKAGSNLRLAPYVSTDLSNWEISTFDYGTESESFTIPITGFDENNSMFWLLDWSTRPEVLKLPFPGSDFPRPDL